ncbi:MAG: response regulator [Nitrospirae bacterium]|nr:response regulator [Nitrospirota bacterium]
MKKLKVLIADDTASMRKFVKYGLEKSFPSILVDEAVNGREAQAKLDHTEYDLVLCDWEMPDINGDKILEWVRSHPTINSTPFIMVTSRNDKESVMQAIQGGVNSYVVKPFSAESLAQKITAVIDHFDRREFQRFEVNGSVNLHFGDQAIRGKIIDVSMGGIFSTVGRKSPLPAIFEKVMVDIKLEISEKLGGIEGFVIRLQAAESFIDSENVKIAVKFMDLPDQRKQELQRVMSSLKQQAQ